MSFDRRIEAGVVRICSTTWFFCPGRYYIANGNKLSFLRIREVREVHSVAGQ
jgi:hypothetical protein